MKSGSIFDKYPNNNSSVSKIGFKKMHFLPKIDQPQTLKQMKKVNNLFTEGSASSESVSFPKAS